MSIWLCLQQTGRLRALGPSWPPRALCQLVAPLTVLPQPLSRPAEADGQHFSGQGSTLLCAFLDPHHPEDQMAPFVSKESSYKISTFDIKMYTVDGVAGYNGPFIPGLLSVYYLVSHRQNDLSAWPAAAPHCNCLCVLAWKRPRLGLAFSWSPVPPPSTPSWTAHRASPLYKIFWWLLRLQYKPPPSLPTQQAHSCPSPPQCGCPTQAPALAAWGHLPLGDFCGFNGYCLKSLPKAEKTGLSGRENTVYQIQFSALDSAHRSPTSWVRSDLILFLPPTRPSI